MSSLLLIVDCGTTTTRAYIVTKEGDVLGRSVRDVGVRATAFDGNTDRLRVGITEAVTEAVQAAAVTADAIGMSIAAGMITSELGLREIPHLLAPAGLPEIADSTVLVSPEIELLPGVPCYFVRGIKNRTAATALRFEDALLLDFMRGEETQVMGLLDRLSPRLPLVCVVLSSHTKFVVIDSDRRIAGSLTTMSGQFYRAILDGTTIGKSVEDDGREAVLDPDKIIDVARQATMSGGVIRSLFVPRFMDTLITTASADRSLYVQACVAFEDSRALKMFEPMGLDVPDNILLVGPQERTALYRRLLQDQGYTEVAQLTDREEIHRLSVSGALSVLRFRGQI